MVNPCEYELEEMEDGSINIAEKYYPVCIRKDTIDKSIYRQECYPESIIAGLGAGDVDPEHADRMIVNCGCCPDTLPADIDKVKGRTGVCDGGVDCLLADQGENVLARLSYFGYYVRMSIGDRCVWGNNFYVPRDDEVASCGC